MFHRLVALLVMIGTCGLSVASEEVVFKDQSGRVLKKSDLQNASGTVDWEIRSSRPVPARAVELHQMGRAAGQRGQYGLALQHFADASELAPDWPYPLYDAAFTHLLQRQYDRALSLYQQVDQMAPRGFFTVKTAVQYLKLEQEGKVPQGTYLKFLSLEWIDRSNEREALVRQLTEGTPSFAPGWKARAALETDPQRRLNYLERGLAVNPDPETKGFLLLNKAAILVGQGKRSEAIRILGSLALDPSSPIDIEALAKQSLATVVAK